MNCIKYLFSVSFCLASLVAVSRAQGPPTKPWYQEGANYWGRSIVGSITGFSADNQKVSGTKVDFSFNVTASGALFVWVPTNPPPPGTHPYNRVKITSVVLKIGGEEVYSGTGAATPADSDGVSKSVRYASTHFNDGSNIELKLDATVELSCVPDGPGTVPPPYTLTLPTVTVTNVAYNKGLFLSSLIEQNGSTHSPPPPSDSLQAVSHALCVDSRVRLAAMKHTNDYTDVRYRSTLENALAVSTVFVGCVHGSPDGFCSSHTHDDESSEFLSWSTVGGAVLRATGIPGHNLAFLYSCETIDGDPGGPGAFDVSGNNKAYGGFGVKVGQYVYDVATGSPVLSLAKHADRILQELYEGNTLNDSLTDTEDAWIPLTAGWTQTGMIVLGDGYATLNCVYVSATEQATYGPGKGKWFLVL